MENNEMNEVNEIAEAAPAEHNGSQSPKTGKKPSGWSYERHIVQCPVCGKDILDHMNVCPFCKTEIEIGGMKPISEATIKRVRIIALIVGVIIAIAIIVPILLGKFGSGA